jgi:hypothetical protein
MVVDVDRPPEGRGGLNLAHRARGANAEAQARPVPPCPWHLLATFGRACLSLAQAVFRPLFAFSPHALAPAHCFRLVAHTLGTSPSMSLLRTTPSWSFRLKFATS